MKSYRLKCLQGRTPATSRKQFSQDEDNTLINSINQLLPKYISGELTKKAIYTQAGCYSHCASAEMVLCP